MEQFRRFGIARCYRLGCDRKDKRLVKVLKKPEERGEELPGEKESPEVEEPKASEAKSV